MTSPCEANPGVFFAPESSLSVAAAKRLCSGCPLSTFTACRKQGWNEEYGIFGGLTPSDRERIRPGWRKDLETRKRLEATGTDRLIRYKRIERLALEGNTHEVIAEQLGMTKANVQAWLYNHRDLKKVAA